VVVNLGQRAQALLKKCLLRRTKDTKLEGKLILQLPPKEIEVVEIDFSPDERDVSLSSPALAGSL
jgi:SNF2 family DNA or RNA helicase